jgi:hypothetical protein
MKIYNVTDLNDLATKRKYDGIEIYSEFPVYILYDENGNNLGILIWSDKENKPPFEEIIAIG